jgi:phosphoribosylglycinamide formyltransferase-1
MQQFIPPNRILILASGHGSNTEALIRFFQSHKLARVCGVLCNRPNAGVLERAWRLGIDAWLFSKGHSQHTENWAKVLQAFNPDWIVLAGWLELIPHAVIDRYPERIINLHPSLLPSYGGKGMYGLRVHEAVIAANERVSGITIHYVSPEYDKGRIIYQETIEVKPGWSALHLQEAIRQVEHRVYPRVIEKLILESAQSV